MNSDDLTATAMHMVHEQLEEMLYALAGKPVGFVLVVSDALEIATSTNLTLPLCAGLLERAHQGAYRRLNDLEES